ncbi:uncharacterized protein EV422DRAFT_531240 [Fimicolochytrium jonesii]|uniref:uncharacterized protein n=1 Tax=Fimicolochytrium jonesii TaxID=1396493 RepID=UPI0022FE62AE|nr:uncharacterized protein EV422DRAFT_531240 [Fimicolochytrium jonesii]KAI8820539.1 hypothetical protein EV422DRAFT_531240 [Fimicolochytrium jonesii]
MPSTTNTPITIATSPAKSAISEKFPWEGRNSLGYMNDKPTDKWRKYIGREERKQLRKGTDLLTTSTALVSDSSQWATSIAVVEESSFIAVGSASETLFILENVDKRTQDLTLRSAITVPDAVYSLAISGTKLLTGGHNGRVQVFNLDQFVLDTKNKGVDHVDELRVIPADLRAPIAPPQRMAGSLRVNVVDFERLEGGDEPAASPTFLATVGKHLYIGDLQTGKTTASEAVGMDTLLSASFTPHPGVRLIAAAGVDRSINILDSRQIGSGSASNIWKVPEAHGLAVNEVKFNPLIPYWLASVGEDSVVKLWDMRFLHYPVGRIDAHYHSIRSLAWSPSRAELLTTVSSDRSWRAWSFNASLATTRETCPSSAFIDSPGTEWGTSPHTEMSDRAVVGAYLVAECTDYTSPPIKVVAGRDRNDAFYSVTGTGQVCCHVVSGDVFEIVNPHRFTSAQNSTAFSIEQSVQTRDLATAYTDIIAHCRAARAENKLLASHEVDLIKLCTSTPPVGAEEWNLPKLEMVERVADREAVENIREELRRWTYWLPPGFGGHLRDVGMIRKKLQQEFDIMVVRCDLVGKALEGDGDAILKEETAFSRGLEVDPLYINGATLRVLSQAIIQHDYTKALTFGLKLAQTVEDTPGRTLADCTEAFGVLLFPTVFDKSKWQPTFDYQPLGADKPAADLLATQSGRDVNDAAKYARYATVAAEYAALLQRRDKEVLGLAEAVSPSLADHSGDENDGRSTVDGTLPPSQQAADDMKNQALRTLIANGGNVLSMLRLQIKLTKIMASPPADTFYNDILRVFDNMNTEEMQESGSTQKRPFVERTISSYAIVLYLDALLHHNRFEDYWGTCFELVNQYASYALPTTLLAHALKIATPDFNAQIGLIYEAATHKLAQALDTSGSNRALDSVLLQAIDKIKEGMVLVVSCGVCLGRLGSGSAGGQRESVEKIRGDLFLRWLGTLQSSLLRALDLVDTTMGAGSMREAAQKIQASIRDSLQPASSGGRARAAQTALAIGKDAKDNPNPVVKFIAEINSVIEQLGKVGRTEVAGPAAAGSIAGTLPKPAASIRESLDT